MLGGKRIHVTTVKPRRFGDLMVERPASLLQDYQ
jgi:hypothetical protein